MDAGEPSGRSTTCKGNDATMPDAAVYGPSTATDIILSILREDKDRDMGIGLNNTIKHSASQPSSPMPRYETNISNATLHLNIPGHIPTVNVQNSYGTRTLSMPEALAVQSATTGSALVSPSGSAMAAHQMLGTSSTPLTPVVVPVTEIQGVEVVSHKKSKKDKKEKEDKHRMHITSVATMIRKKSSSCERSTKSLGKRSRNLQLVCTKSLLMSQMGEEGTQNTKKWRFSDVTAGSNGAESECIICQDHGIPPRGIKAVHPMTTMTDAKATGFQDHHTLQQDNEVFASDTGVSANEMLCAGYDMLQKGQQLLQQIRKAMDQQAKTMEALEA